MHRAGLYIAKGVQILLVPKTPSQLLGPSDGLLLVIGPTNLQKIKTENYQKSIILTERFAILLEGSSILFKRSMQILY